MHALNFDNVYLFIKRRDLVYYGVYVTHNALYLVVKSGLKFRKLICLGVKIYADLFRIGYEFVSYCAFACGILYGIQRVEHL